MTSVPAGLVLQFMAAQIAVLALFPLSCELRGGSCEARWSVALAGVAGVTQSAITLFLRPSQRRSSAAKRSAPVDEPLV